MVNWKKDSSHVYFKQFFCSDIENSFLTCGFLHRHFPKILLIALELPALKMDFCEGILKLDCFLKSIHEVTLS